MYCVIKKILFVILLAQFYWAPSFSAIPLEEVKKNIHSMVGIADKIIVQDDPTLEALLPLANILNDFTHCSSTILCEKLKVEFQVKLKEIEVFSLEDTTDRFYPILSVLVEIEDFIQTKEMNHTNKIMLEKLFYIMLSLGLQEEIRNIFSPLFMSSYYTFKVTLLRENKWNSFFNNIRKYDFEWNEFFMRLTKEFPDNVNTNILLMASTMHQYWNNTLKLLF